jgi:hypothetical protein
MHPAMAKKMPPKVYATPIYVSERRNLAKSFGCIFEQALHDADPPRNLAVAFQ